jgi:predicted nucleic acid-binding protein
MKYVVDTNIFNRLADGVDVLGRLPADAQLIATHIQIDEINSTIDKERRARLFLAFAHFRPTLLPTETAVWGVSRWGEAKWGEGPYFNAIGVALDSRNHSKSNNREDALIAEVALTHGYGLVTADRDLAKVVEECGGNVVLILP